jgi:hypothetical protein
MASRAGRADVNTNIIRTYFGRSGTVVPSTRIGAYSAPEIVALAEVSVTGSEYPTLYGAASHIAADLLAADVLTTAGRYELLMHVSKATRRPCLIESGTLRRWSGRPHPSDELQEETQPTITYRVVGKVGQLSEIPDIGLLDVTGDFLGREYKVRIREADTFESVFGYTDSLVAAEDPAFGLLWAGVESETLEREDDDTPRRSQPSLVQLAEEIGAVEAEAMPREALSGNLVRDVLSLTGFTAAELARVVGRTERSVRQWIADGHVPAPAEQTLQQLRTIALRLVGGLGPRGVRRWLTAGSPSPADRIAAGAAQQVLDETERLLDSPAT